MRLELADDQLQLTLRHQPHDRLAHFAVPQDREVRAKPFRWTKSAKQILDDAVERAQAANA